jgi:hypothetical protein
LCTCFAQVLHDLCTKRCIELDLGKQTCLPLTTNKKAVLSKLEEIVYSPDMIVTTEELRKCISVTKCGKSSGPDGLGAECFKFASDKLLVHLACCFTAMLTHSYIPDDFARVCLIPIVKNKCADVTCKDNYRPIALATVASKLMEMLILQRCENNLYTADAQFGFKPNHSTETCIYVLKEIIHLYVSRGSPVVICFMDASKALDRVNHWTLYHKQLKR